MLSQSQGCFDFPFQLTFQSKRQLTLIGFALRRFIVGINYAIVIPSLWFYLESFGAPYYFLGIAIAADSLLGVFVAPFVGKIYDATRKIRIIGLTTILLDLIGNIVYALPLHAYMPIIGRCISGLGSGYVSALYGEVARVTTPEERTRIVTIMEGVRLLGITIGPSFNFFLQYFDFSIGPWRIDKRTAPGFFMAILWSIVAIVHLFTVYNLTEGYKDIEDAILNGNDDETTTPEARHDSKGMGKYSELPSSDDEDSSSEEGLTYIDILKTQRKHTRVREKGVRKVWHSFKEILQRSELLVLFFTQFLMYFNQSSFETLAPLIGVVLLDFNITHLSALYVAAGVELVIVIVVVWFVSHYIADRNLLLSAVAMGVIGVFAQLSVALTKPHTGGCLAMALLMTFFMLLATPIISIVGKSLLSKITAVEEQGFYQGMLASAQQLGLISGPLVGSALFEYLTYFSSVTLFVLTVVYVMTLRAMDKLI